MSQKITVLIPCRNEQDNITKCIENARLIADEILVADSGSTDGTQAAVRAARGCRIIEREWNGYAAFKNWAIPQATHPWVLIVDADERVTKALASEIRQQLTGSIEDVDAWRIRFTTFFIGHELRYSNWNNAATRLIRRDACRYGDRLVHEEIHIEPDRVRYLDNQLLHYSIRDYDHFFEKYIHYTALGAHHMWQKGRRATFASLLFRPFFRFLFLYVVRGGFRDGRVGVQVCMLGAFFNTFFKQARLWELQQLTDRAEEVTASPDTPECKNRAA